MGVPAFFRWLSRKYPSVIIECVEKKEEDASAPNPNGVEFDNLYLDMNGIIHPCTHPEDKPAPKNEDEMMVAIFECIDRLFNIVRPRKVLYMAIDGVAPRAKMNQQRSRRFRASKESAEKAIELARIREELLERGCILPPQTPKGEVFDSNCITPGTPFMDKLSKCLQYYIHDRLNNCPSWKGIKVVLSDANVPGEGEHKIMDYIRKQRAQPDHDPNTQHVLCGADADLIMLGLATHEPNFTIIREEFLPNKPRPCEICSLFGHEAKDCNGLDITGADTAVNDQMQLCKETNFIFVRLCVLKEYLERELEMPNLPFEYDFERVVDDWVFLCFFVGNDFLPHLPSLEIRENAIDRLINLYKKCVYKTGGYLTDSGDVALERVEMIMVDLGYMEDAIFKDRQKSELRFRENAKRRKLQEQMRKPDYKAMFNTQFMPTALGAGAAPAALTNVRQEAAEIRKREMDKPQPQQQGGQKRKADAMENDKEEEDPEANDEVRLWENGFKDRYYQSKFDVEPDDLQFRNTVALEYVRGLCWVLKYYYQGCVSWSWYFPYHYAPFASDFLNVSGLGTKFDRGEPFFPLEQLMGVFPAASKKHVPEVFGKLMDDPNSPIIDFYPEDFKIDLNGKKFAWQGVALLPFVDEKRLFKALLPVKSQLSEEETNRNKTGEDRLLIGPGCSAYKSFMEFYRESDLNELDTVIDGVKCTIIKSSENVGLNGTLHSPLKTHSEINNNNVVTVLFRNPHYADDFKFPAKPLEGAVRAPRILKGQDVQDPNYRPKMGFGNYNQQASFSAAGDRMLNHHLPNQYQNYQRNSYPHQQQGGYNNYNNQGGNRHGDNSRGNQQRNSYGGDSRGAQQRYGGESRPHPYQRNSFPLQQQGGYNNYNNQGGNRYGDQSRGNNQRNSYGNSRGGQRYGESRPNYGGDSRRN